MSIWVITNMLLTLSLTLIVRPNPFSIGLLILLTALIIACIYSLTCSSWLGFLIFLIYIGGILIIFSYFLAIIPNQSTINIKLILLPVSTLFISLLTSIFAFDSWTTSFTNPKLLTEFIFSYYNHPLLIIILLTLLFTMIIVVKICNLSKGPLRAFISYV